MTLLRGPCPCRPQTSHSPDLEMHERAKTTDMTIQDAIAAAGQVPPLRNPEAEKAAQDIASVILDPEARQAAYAAFVATHPGLKEWEAQVIRNRALCIARENQTPQPE